MNDMSKILEQDDPIILNEHFNQLRAAYEQRRQAQERGELRPPEGLSEIALAAWHAEQDELTATMIRDQIALIAKLRRTTQGPARKGGKRAKSAPVDLDAMLDDLSKLA